MFYNSTWGTVCDDHWNLAGAHVVCRQLDCGMGLSAIGGARYGRGKDPIWLDNVQCTGMEAALSECRARPWGNHNCGHGEDVSVVCSGEACSGLVLDHMTSRGPFQPEAFFDFVLHQLLGTAKGLNGGQNCPSFVVAELLKCTEHGAGKRFC